MRNVHYTCDRCGETLKRPGLEGRNENDAPDVVLAINAGMSALRFDMCPPCFKSALRALEIGKTKRAEPIGPNRGTIGDALDSLAPYNAKL